MQYDVSNTTTTSMQSAVPNFVVIPRTIDESMTTETKWYSSDFTKWLGYYKTVPELKQAIDSLAMWVAGRGYTTDSETKVILENIKGWGEDSFDTILRNMLIIKKINGDAFAEIIRDPSTKTIVNLKPLNPSNMAIVVDDKGIITGYEEHNNKEKIRKLPINKIFHISNNRIANEIHGASVVESCKNIIDARNEAMADYRRVLHRSTIRIMYVEVDDTERQNAIKTNYAEAIKYGELMLIPAKKGEAEIADYTAPNPEIFLAQIRYLENIFYQAVGVPKIILGGSQEYTQADSKIGYLTFEQPIAAEQRELEQDIWNQLFIRISFERPVSLKDKVQSDEAANTTETGFQANDVNSDVTRSE